jgi:hypothetical protein
MIQNRNFVCIRFILWARSVSYFLVHLFLLVLRFACRFKVLLGTARTTQIGGGVTVAKAQRSPCGVVFGQHNVDTPQIELSPTLIERSGANPSGFYHVSYCTKDDAKLSELVPLTHKFSKQSCVRIFRNERTRSTPLDPKLMFWGVLDRFVTTQKSMQK